MNNRITRINKSFSVLITLIVTCQGSIQYPVACLESDGRINLEADCELARCEINIKDENNNVDLCQECVDIPLWPYCPEFKQAIRADYRNLGFTAFDLITQTTFIYKQYKNFVDPLQYNLVTNTQPQLAIRSTRLLL